MAEEHGRKQAEKAYQRAEELFLTGNIRGAHREASKAKRLCPSLAAAAADRPADDWWWRAVLGVARGAATRDAVKRQFRRLSLLVDLVHPDKNRSAAAEGAFRLLRQARDDAVSSLSSPCRRASAMVARGGEEGAGASAPASAARGAGDPVQGHLLPVLQARARQALRAPAGAGGLAVRGLLQLAEPAVAEEAGASDSEHGGCAAAAGEEAAPRGRVPVPRAVPGVREAVHVQGVRRAGEWCLRCKACSRRAVVTVQGPGLATATINPSASAFLGVASRGVRSL
ncbi:unnamed protein product [Urochloa humidicola]